MQSTCSGHGTFTIEPRVRGVRGVRERRTKGDRGDFLLFSFTGVIVVFVVFVVFVVLWERSLCSFFGGDLTGETNSMRKFCRD